MATITNNFAEGACIFMSGSTMNGDVTITNCAIHQESGQSAEQAAEASLADEHPQVDMLDTPEAQALWQTAQQNGWVDERRQPLISQTKAAIMASIMSDTLGLTPRWAAFERLWGIPALATKLSKAQFCNHYNATLEAMEKALAKTQSKNQSRG